jgi:hypothetical protein
VPCCKDPFTRSWQWCGLHSTAGPVFTLCVCHPLVVNPHVFCHGSMHIEQPAV